MKYYKISEQDLRMLLKSDEKLNMLESYGVDNWEGYGVWYQEDPDYNADEVVDALIKAYDEI